jgi:hypothetical protein
VPDSMRHSERIPRCCALSGQCELMVSPIFVGSGIKAKKAASAGIVR